MSELAERVEARIRAEWPGLVMTARGGVFIAPEIQPGGVTDGFVTFVAAIVAEEAAEVEELAWMYGEVSK